MTRRPPVLFCPAGQAVDVCPQGQCMKGPASAPERWCGATHNFDTRHDLGPRGPSSETLAGCFGAHRGEGLQTEFSGKSRLPGLNARLRLVGTRRGTPLPEGPHQLDATRGLNNSDCNRLLGCVLALWTSFGTHIHRSKLNATRTDRRSGQETRTLTQRYRTQLGNRRHLQGGEPRRNTIEQFRTSGSPCLQKRCLDDALGRVRPTLGGGRDRGRKLTQLTLERGRNTTRTLGHLSFRRCQPYIYAGGFFGRGRLPGRNATLENHRSRRDGGRRH